MNLTVGMIRAHITFIEIIEHIVDNFYLSGFPCSYESDVDRILMPCTNFFNVIMIVTPSCFTLCLYLSHLTGFAKNAYIHKKANKYY